MIGFLGRLSAEKRIDEFVRAMPLILQQQPQIRFLIIGSGPLEAALKRSVSEERWASRVTWLGWVDHACLPDYLNQLKLLVLPSHGTEGLPKAILEAMGCGVPVLASPVGGIPDVIADGVTGFLLTDTSASGIAQNVLRVLNSDILTEVAHAAQRHVEQNFSLPAACSRYNAILAEWPGHKGRRPTTTSAQQRTNGGNS